MYIDSQQQSHDLQPLSCLALAYPPTPQLQPRPATQLPCANLGLPLSQQPTLSLASAHMTEQAPAHDLTSIRQPSWVPNSQHAQHIQPAQQAQQAQHGVYSQQAQHGQQGMYSQQAQQAQQGVNSQQAQQAQQGMNSQQAQHAQQAQQDVYSQQAKHAQHSQQAQQAQDAQQAQQGMYSQQTQQTRHTQQAQQGMYSQQAQQGRHSQQAQQAQHAPYAMAAQLPPRPKQSVFSSTKPSSSRSKAHLAPATKISGAADASSAAVHCQAALRPPLALRFFLLAQLQMTTQDGPTWTCFLVKCACSGNGVLQEVHAHTGCTAVQSLVGFTRDDTHGPVGTLCRYSMPVMASQC